jgi:hypothetical protein
MTQPIIDVGVNERPFLIAEVNSAEGVTITEKAKNEQGIGKNTVEPNGYCYC